MKGKVLLFDHNSQKGVIVDKKQNQYHFHIGEWLSEESIVVGKEVIFDMPKEEAFNIQVKKKRNFFYSCLKMGKSFFNKHYKQKN